MDQHDHPVANKSAASLVRYNKSGKGSNSGGGGGGGGGSNSSSGGGSSGGLADVAAAKIAVTAAATHADAGPVVTHTNVNVIFLRSSKNPRPWSLFSSFM